MAMETDVVRSDTQTVFNKMQEYLKLLFKLLLLKVILPLFKRVTSYVYRHNVEGKKRVLQDGSTKGTDRIKGLSYEECQKVLIDYEQKGIETYIVAENREDNVVDKKKTKAAIESFTKTSRSLNKTKEKLADKPQSNRLQRKVEKLEAEYQRKNKEMSDGFDKKKYKTLLNEELVHRYGKVFSKFKSQKNIGKIALEKIYDASCTGEPIKFTIVTNVRHKEQNEKTRENIREARTAKKQEKIDNILSVTETEEYEKMPYDKDEFDRIVTSQKEKLGRELNINEINEIKEECKYEQITVEQFKADAQNDNMGYCVYQYNKDKVDAICRELNSNDEIEKFTCEFAKNTEGKEIVNIYIFDKDVPLYEHKDGVPFQHFCNKVDITNGDNKLSNQTIYKGTKVTVDYEQADYARNKFRNLNYTFNIIDNNGEKRAQFVLEKISNEDAKKMLIEERESNPVEESLLKHKEKNRERTRKYIKDNINQPVITTVSEMRKKVNDNETTKDFIEKYDELKNLNGNNDLSSDKFNEFADAYFSKNNKEELATLSKTLPEKNVKNANINENIEVNKNDNVDLADNELIANDFNGFDELNLDGKD